LTLYILVNDQKQANWQPVYEETYRDVFRKLGIDWVELNADTESYVLRSLSLQDVLWVMHFKDLLLPEVAETAAKVVFRMSGTSTHPYCYQVNMADEDYALRHVIDVNLSFHPRMTEYVKRFYPNISMVDTGYPIHVPKLPVAQREPGTIVVGGRLSPDKQFMLTAYMLQDYVRRDWRVRFCYPNSGGKDDYWLEQYGGKERYKRLGFEFVETDKAGWHQILNTSEYFFTASLGDTACVSCVEAVSLGCYPLVPRIREGLPVYDTYINVGYEPFSTPSLYALIHQKPSLVVDNTWFDPMNFGRRFKERVLCE